MASCTQLVRKKLYVLINDLIPRTVKKTVSSGSQDLNLCSLISSVLTPRAYAAAVSFHQTGTWYSTSFLVYMVTDWSYAIYSSLSLESGLQPGFQHQQPLKWGSPLHSGEPTELISSLCLVSQVREEILKGLQSSKRNSNGFPNQTAGSGSSAER